jgi:hypothetical protein
LKYIVAAGAVANNAHLWYELGVQTNVSWSTETVYLPTLWGILGIIIYGGGIVIVRLRLHLAKGMSEVSRLRHGPGLEQDCLEYRGNEWLPIMLTQVASIGTAIQVALGTAILSSLLFITPSDAFQVLARYFTSNTICRFIVKYELWEMRRTVKPPKSGLGVRVRANRPLSSCAMKANTGMDD